MTKNEAEENPILTVVVNDQAVLEYDRRKPLAARQRLYLDHMDRDMDNGVPLEGRHQPAPDLRTRAQFVATSLLQALETGNDGVAAATCSYLAVRLPDLKQVRAHSNAGQLVIDLVFDQAYVPTQTVQFTRPGGKKGLH